MITITSLAIALLAAKNVAAVGSPFGFATGTTGGNGAAQAVPTSAAQLKSWLEDNVTRNILLDRTYDFTDTEGSITGKVCKSFTCSPNPQLSIDTGSGCGSSASSTATWKKAGTAGILVKSNKSIIGKGTSGWIKGKGLKLQGVSNVIIQNIRISDLNPQYVWGGDAIDLSGATNVWIDHNYFKSVGRQFIVSHFEPNTKVTISNNYFDGQSTWSTGCDQHHYWAFLLLGKNDQITFARNHLYYTSGRGPHIGGTSGNKQLMHMYNNYFNDITGHALDADVGGTVLAEGNYFNKVKTPSTGNTNGAVFAPTSSSMADQCTSNLGRKCVLNSLAGGSGALTNTAKNSIVSQFTASTVKSASIMDPSTVASYVLANAGTGKVN
ncbi:hypothetical protein RhiTH_011036 [Rhizoctonia solani]